MENFKEGKHKTSFERIIGTKSATEKKEVRKTLQQKLSRKEAKFKPFELIPTERDKEIIKIVSSITDKLISFYGGKINHLPLNRLHIVKPGTVKKVTEGKFSKGLQSPIKQAVIVEKESSELQFSAILSHELLHLKSYKSAQIDKNGDLIPYRSGLQSFSRKGDIIYFNSLEEAIVATTNQIAFAEIKTRPIFKDEISEIEGIKNWLRDFYTKNNPTDKEALEETIFEIIFIPESNKLLNFLQNSNESDEYKIGYLQGYLDIAKEIDNLVFAEREEERKKFYDLINDIIEKSNGEFKEWNEVFDIFAKANFSGNLMPLARLVEKTLGKGSFRKIAKEF